MIAEVPDRLLRWARWSLVAEAIFALCLILANLIGLYGELANILFWVVIWIPQVAFGVTAAVLSLRHGWRYGASRASATLLLLAVLLSPHIVIRVYALTSQSWWQLQRTWNKTQARLQEKDLESQVSKDYARLIKELQKPKRITAMDAQIYRFTLEDDLHVELFGVHQWRAVTEDEVVLDTHLRQQLQEIIRTGQPLTIRLPRFHEFSEWRKSRAKMGDSTMPVLIYDQGGELLNLRFPGSPSMLHYRELAPSY